MTPAPPDQAEAQRAYDAYVEEHGRGELPLWKNLDEWERGPLLAVAHAMRNAGLEAAAQSVGPLLEEWVRGGGEVGLQDRLEQTIRALKGVT